MVREDFCEEMAGDIWSELEMNVAEKRAVQETCDRKFKTKSKSVCLWHNEWDMCNKYCLPGNTEICSLVSQKWYISTNNGSRHGDFVFRQGLRMILPKQREDKICFKIS